MKLLTLISPIKIDVNLKNLIVKRLSWVV